MTDAATPGAAEIVYGIDRVTLPEGLAVSSISEYLRELPELIGSMQQRDITSTSDSATAVYLGNETAPQPDFGMIVVIKVTPAPDSEQMVATIAASRWGNPELHTISDQSANPSPLASPSADATGADPAASPPGNGKIRLAYRAFSRSFPPGQFAIPNQPVYFLIWYRVGDEYAYMVIGHSTQAREALARAMVAAFGEGG